MLKNLVKKFTSHSLNDGDGNSGAVAEDASNAGAHDSTTSANNATASAPPTTGQSHKSRPSAPAAATGHHHLRRLQQHSVAPPPLNSTGRQASKRSSTTNNAPRRFHASDKVHHNSGAYRRSHAPSTVSGKSHGSSVPSDPGKDDEINDSGTESDEELAIIETNSLKSVPVSLTSDYYTSQHSLSASCRSSHCGSPSIDQDCVSWESFGCDSSTTGINWSSRNSEAANQGDLEVELPNHHYHTRQQFKKFVTHHQKELISSNERNQHQAAAIGSSAQSQSTTEKDIFPNETAHETPTVTDYDSSSDKELASPAVSCGSSADELESINGSSSDQLSSSGNTNNDVREKEAEFLAPEHPITNNAGRGRSSFIICKSVNQRSGSHGATRSATVAASIAMGTAEKRKWSQVATPPVPATTAGDFSGVAPADCALRNAENHSTAARRTPVRLLIPPDATGDEGESGDAEEAPSVAVGGANNSSQGRFAVPANPSPRKKCKSATTANATVQNQEALAAISGAAALHQAASSSDGSERQRPCLNFEKMREKLKSKSARKKHGRSGTMAMKSKLRGWNIGYQLRSTHSECLFQPLKFPPSPPSMSTMGE